MGGSRSVDLDAVRSAPGVITVLTAEDLPHENDVSPSPSPEPLLAESMVHFVGQPIFLVAADQPSGGAESRAKLAKVADRAFARHPDAGRGPGGGQPVRGRPAHL